MSKDELTKELIEAQRHLIEWLALDYFTDGRHEDVRETYKEYRRKIAKIESHLSQQQESDHQRITQTVHI